jgi:hypothetical protein
VAALDNIELVPPPREEDFLTLDTAWMVLAEVDAEHWDETFHWLVDHPQKVGCESLVAFADAIAVRLSANPAGTLQAIADSKLFGIENALKRSLEIGDTSMLAGVRQWLDQQRPNSFTTEIRSAFFSAAARRDPMFALTFLERLKAIPENQPVLDVGVQSVVNNAIQVGGLERILDAASKDVRSHLLAAVILYRKEEVRPEPWKWIARLDEVPLRKREYAVCSLAAALVETDPIGAVTWVLAQAVESEREAGLFQVVRSWASADPDAAVKWMETQPAGTIRDIATTVLVTEISDSDPERAWRLALELEGKHRFGALKSAYMQMLRRDRDWAFKALTAANLSFDDFDMLRRASIP